MQRSVSPVKVVLEVFGNNQPMAIGLPLPLVSPLVYCDFSCGPCLVLCICILFLFSDINSFAAAGCELCVRPRVGINTRQWSANFVGRYQNILSNLRPLLVQFCHYHHPYD